MLRHIKSVTRFVFAFELTFGGFFGHIQCVEVPILSDCEQVATVLVLIDAAGKFSDRLLCHKAFIDIVRAEARGDVNILTLEAFVIVELAVEAKNPQAWFAARRLLCGFPRVALDSIGVPLAAKKDALLSNFEFVNSDSLYCPGCQEDQTETARKPKFVDSLKVCHRSLVCHTPPHTNILDNSHFRHNRAALHKST